MKIKQNIGFPAVAAAVAVACGVADAGVLTSGTVLRRVGTEFVTAQVAAVPSYGVALPAINFSVRSDAYRTGDTVTVTIGGASVSSVAANINFTCSDTTATGAGSGINSAGMTFSFQSNASGVLTYKVEKTGDTNAVYLSALTAVTCSLATNKIFVSGANLRTASAVTVNIQPTAYSSNIPYDGLTNNPTVNETATGGAGAVTVLRSGAQFNLNSLTLRDPFANVLDAAAGSQSTLTKTTLSGSGFGSTTAGQYVSATFTYNDEGAADGGQLSVTGTNPGVLSFTDYASSYLSVTTLNGDFSFLDDDQNGCTSADLSYGAGQFTATGGTTTINAACTVITMRQSVTAAPAARAQAKYFAFSLNGIDAFTALNASAANVGRKAGRTLVAQTFTGDIAITSTDAATGAVTNVANFTLAPGAWSAAAASTTGAINVPYIPYGTGISRILYFTNKGTTAGTATFDARNDAGTVCSSANFGSVSIPASGVALLTGAIDAGIAACYGAAFTGKAQVNVTVTGTGTGDVTSSYRIGDNRVNIINSSNK